MADLGYLNDQLSFLILTPYKKPANRELTNAEKTYNEAFNAHRVMIEQFFGYMKQRFPIFRCGYRGPIKLLHTLFRLGVALTNKSIERGNLTDREKRDAYLLERRQQKFYEDKPYNYCGNMDDLPEFARRYRVGRVVMNHNRRQEENEECDIANHRRGNRPDFDRRFNAIQARRAEQHQADVDYMAERANIIRRRSVEYENQNRDDLDKRPPQRIRFGIEDMHA
ncbi:1-aminocyclopropane-1-carboxylate synthase [Acrasis kona]|uniref:1-aminocyclopropane-1-carboxylate synthase n=1 Tax=Acrasis kona TaxID=1008807 RepID=A0AAW2YLI8_9EUKA